MQFSVRRFLIVCLSLCAFSVSAEIYKWRDAHGVMNYSDVPPSAEILNAQKIKAAPISDNWPLTRSDAYQKNAADAEIKAAQDQTHKKDGAQVANGDSKAAEALQAVQDRIRAQNCASARSNYRNYSIGGRMQTVNDDGQKAYLSDEQIQQGLAAAQQEIQENCPPE